jgi:hypothetical protein
MSGPEIDAAMDEMAQQAIADRFSAALTEVGEASAALVLAEREACARVLDGLIADTLACAKAQGAVIGQINTWLSQVSILREAARGIRERPK